jgi:hypothetical protein
MIERDLRQGIKKPGKACTRFVPVQFGCGHEVRLNLVGQSGVDGKVSAILLPHGCVLLYSLIDAVGTLERVLGLPVVLGRVAAPLSGLFLSRAKRESLANSCAGN